MAPARKSSKSGAKQAVLRQSPRKRNIPEVTDKTPSRKSRAVKLGKALPSTSESEYSDYFNTPSTSSGSKSEKVCSFYKVGKTKGPNGVSTPKFSKSLIKYFMKIDSPEMDDLRCKRFNTSFRREIPRNRDSLKIFTEEEDNDQKWWENVPELNFDMPDIPGSEHAKVFETIPLNGDSDEELKTKPKSKRGVKRRKSIRCAGYKGKPLPDECLLVDYSSVLDSESSCDDTENDHKEKDELGTVYPQL